MPPEEAPRTPKPVEPSTPSPLKQIRTYQGDIAEALKRQQESVVSIQRQEQARTARVVEATPDETPEEKSSRRKAILLLSGILICFAVGSAVAWYAYTSYKTKTALPVILNVPNAFVSPNKTININTLSLSRETLISTLETQRQGSRTEHLTQLELRTGDTDISPLLPTETFLSLIRSHAPASLVRAFNPLFMLGILTGQNASHTFLLIKLDSYDNAYPGLLAWETNMRDDLLPIFASSTVVDLVPSDTLFKDATIQNKDVRVLKDQGGNTVLLYTFFNNSLLVVTDNEDSLKAILGQLSSEQLSR